MQTFWKVLSIILVATFFSCLLLSVSMYSWPDMPTSPRPAEGRIYPLNDHGHYTYMNEPEHRLRTVIWWVLPILIVAICTIQHFKDPSGEQRKWRLYGRVPREFR
jgi:hypothetical protein